MLVLCHIFLINFIGFWFSFFRFAIKLTFVRISRTKKIIIPTFLRGKYKYILKFCQILSFVVSFKSQTWSRIMK